MNNKGVGKFTKIPVTIDACQLTWENWDDICKFVPKPWFVEGVYVDPETNEVTTKTPNDTSGVRIGLRMQTLESQEFLAVENDWIIKGVNGEFYPCKPDVFEKTYRQALG